MAYTYTMKNCHHHVNVDTIFSTVSPATKHYALEAINALKAGRVIALPTDTLYGFASHACSSEAVNRIYEIKGRKHTSPLAICVGDVAEIKRFAVTDHLPPGLLDSLLPGPVTVILNRGQSSILEKSLNPGLESVGIRVPDNDFIRITARGLGSALALTSANLSGKPSSVCIKDFETLWEHCAHVYDGGVLPAGRAGSTIVDLTRDGIYKILRPGSFLNIKPLMGKKIKSRYSDYAIVVPDCIHLYTFLQCKGRNGCDSKESFPGGRTDRTFGEIGRMQILLPHIPL
ncbi:hypothetical protein ACFE04_014114 [Oxalis oulophora]